MPRAIGVAGAVVAALWFGWNLYRHLLVYAVRRRVVVATDRVMAEMLAAAGLGLALAGGSVSWAVAGGTLVVAAGAVLLGRLWTVVGTSRDTVFARARLILRGMGFAIDREDEAVVVAGAGRIRVGVVAAPGFATLLLRVPTARGINKVALFRANLRKYLVAGPRERRARP